MDLRTLPDGLSPKQRIDERRARVEKELGTDLSLTEPNDKVIGAADEKNCEQMFGVVPVPVGYAGLLKVTFSDGVAADLHLPLATTEGALVASTNRGCKALSQTGSVHLISVYHGMTRSLAFKANGDADACADVLRSEEPNWKKAGEATSGHLKILQTQIDTKDGHVFLTINCDTDEAMGMNMITIAASAIGEWISQNVPGLTFVTVAGNVDSDKKPSKRTHDLGRGYEVRAEAVLSKAIIETIFKTTPQAMLGVADAKLKAGSSLAGAIGANLHAANIVAALYLATGQDAAHVVEGSMTDTSVSLDGESLKISVRMPAILVGVRGGGTSLPVQSQCLAMLLKPKTGLHPCKQLAESIAAAVLAGELSLLAAQASHTLASAHKKMGR
jgi:hydroxymethylglutaryl-CoA reductase (NADPH)